jgi:hypothetical protein
MRPHRVATKAAVPGEAIHFASVRLARQSGSLVVAEPPVSVLNATHAIVSPASCGGGLIGLWVSSSAISEIKRPQPSRAHRCRPSRTYAYSRALAPVLPAGVSIQILATLG